jgi:hypothetical protein
MLHQLPQVPQLHLSKTPLAATSKWLPPKNSELHRCLQRLHRGAGEGVGAKN